MRNQEVRKRYLKMYVSSRDMLTVCAAVCMRLCFYAFIYSLNLVGTFYKPSSRSTYTHNDLI